MPRKTLGLANAMLAVINVHIGKQLQKYCAYFLKVSNREDDDGLLLLLLFGVLDDEMDEDKVDCKLVEGSIFFCAKQKAS